MGLTFVRLEIGQLNYVKVAQVMLRDPYCANLICFDIFSIIIKDLPSEQPMGVVGATARRMKTL